MADDQLPARRARRIFDPSAAVPVVRRITPDDVLGHFLSSYRGSTLKAYDADLKDFGAFMGVGAHQAVASLLQAGRGSANALVLAYRNALEAQGLSPATIARRLSAIKSVVKIARTLEQVEWSIEIEAPTVEAYRDTRGPGNDGMRRVLAELSAQALSPDAARAKIARRDLAVIRLLYDLGLRRSEVVSLDLEHIELEGTPPRPASLWTRRKGRGEKERFSLPPASVLALMDWLALRGDAPGPVFVQLHPGVKYSGGGGRISGQAVGVLANRAGIRAKVERRVRPHGFRHAAITRLLERGHPITDVQKFSGHKNVQTILRYDDSRKDSKAALARDLGDDLA